MKLFRPMPCPPARRRVLTSAAASALAVLLMSCGTGMPGVAATVGDARITDREVDDFAQVLCALGAAPEGGGTPTGQTRFGALEIIVGNELAAGVADIEGIDRQAVDIAVQQASASRERVPEGLREVFDEMVVDYARAQYAIMDLGRESLEEQGQDPDAIQEDAAYAEGDRIRREYAEEVGVEVDPRFGRMVDGALQPADGSLSVPVSDFAVELGSPDAGAAAGQLPATQLCG